MTASKHKVVMRASPWASMVCIPVFLMTLVPYWNYYAIWACGSFMDAYSVFMVAVKSAVDSAGSAVILAVMIWRRASALSRRILELCVIANLYALFVVTGQRLDYLDRRFFDFLRDHTYQVMTWVGSEAHAVAASRQLDVGGCVKEVLGGCRDAWGRKMWVLAEPDGGVGEVVSLASSGADGVAGTADDVRLSVRR